MCRMSNLDICALRELLENRAGIISRARLWADTIIKHKHQIKNIGVPRFLNGSRAFRLLITRSVISPIAGEAKAVA